MSHTPTQGSPAVFGTPLQHYSSDTNIAEPPQPLREALSFTNIASRKSKRKNDDISKSEIFDLFASLKEDQDLKFSAILSSINEVKISMDSMSHKYDEVLQRLVVLEDEKKTYDLKINSLERKVEFLERNAKVTSIEIRNIPQPNKETKEDLRSIVRKTADVLHISLDSNTEIRDIYRSNSKAQVRPIVVDFTTVSARDSFLVSSKKFNKEHQSDKLSTRSLGIGGLNKPIYISENLTHSDRNLYFLAREFARQCDYSFCWTSFGRIYLRKAEGLPQIRIASERDLQNLKEVVSTM